jgi:tetratricopeptide (TPR) repeat protein
MEPRESLITLLVVRKLTETGRHTDVVESLSAQPAEALEQSPTLALQYGIAHARVGSRQAGERWVALALDRSRERGDGAVEAWALNAGGVIAFEAGRTADAVGHFMRGLTAAKREGDHATVGRCSNNLGIISNLRGNYGRAVGSYTIALAAFQQARMQRGIAETLNNLAITNRDQGDLVNALKTADRAVEEAEKVGDRALTAQTRGGRAEIRLLLGDAQFARREIERVLETRRELGDVIQEAEDLRVLAGALAAMEQTADAARMFCDVIERAEEHRRPLLAAQAERDLAWLLHRAGRLSESTEAARKARVRFNQLRAEAEAEKLDELLGPDGFRPDSAQTPIT